MNTLVHSFGRDLAGKSCSVTIHDQQYLSLGMMDLHASSSVLRDLPHYLALHLDVPEFNIVYLGPELYEGNAECVFYAVRDMCDVQVALDDIGIRSRPQLIVADLHHLGQDESFARSALIDLLYDGDMWDEQVYIKVCREMPYVHTPSPESYNSGYTAQA